MVCFYFFMISSRSARRQLQETVGKSVAQQKVPEWAVLDANSTSFSLRGFCMRYKARHNAFPDLNLLRAEATRVYPSLRRMSKPQIDFIINSWLKLHPNGE
jgi:hypothetical protein